MTIVIPTWLLWLIGVPLGLIGIGCALLGAFTLFAFRSWFN